MDYDQTETVDLTDPNGHQPGDPGYNVIGAQVNYIHNLTGLDVQHSPRRNGLVIGPHRDSIGTSKTGKQASDAFFTELALATEAAAAETSTV
jgi:hypothetical protein